MMSLYILSFLRYYDHCAVLTKLARHSAMDMRYLVRGLKGNYAKNVTNISIFDSFNVDEELLFIFFHCLSY